MLDYFGQSSNFSCTINMLDYLYYLHQHKFNNVSKQLLEFLFGVVILVTFSFATPPPVPALNYMNVVEKSHFDQIPSSFAKLTNTPSPYDPNDPDAPSFPFPFPDPLILIVFHNPLTHKLQLV